MFFSVKYADRGELFEELKIWEDEKFRKLQGSWPVISLSFSNVKAADYSTMRGQICQILEIWICFSGKESADWIKYLTFE